MKKSFIVATVLVLLGISFFVMSPKKNDLSKLENPRLIVKKNERLLQIFEGERFIKDYEMVLGFSPVGDKEIEGDGKTPTGEFYIFTKNPNSKFHLSLGVSYPNIDAAERGLKENLISQAEYDAIVKAVGEKQMPPQNTRLGGEIYIHGGGTRGDWTEGCVALENEEMTELFAAIPIGAAVRIEP